MAYLVNNIRFIKSKIFIGGENNVTTQSGFPRCIKQVPPI